MSVEPIEHSESGILAGLTLAIVYVVTGHPTECTCPRCAKLAADLQRAIVAAIDVEGEP